VVIIGLDPGIATTGYGVVETSGSRVRAVAFGVVKTSPRSAHANRLATIHAAVAELAREHAADGAAVEDLYIGPDPRSSLLLAQARGAAIAALGTAGLEVGEYSVATIKNAVCGFGRAEKGQVSRMVRAILALDTEPANEHVADALAAAICHAQHAGGRQRAAAGARA
jgi:crossover junction endodeoxyribonuclease RuvC